MSDPNARNQSQLPPPPQPDTRRFHPRAFGLRFEMGELGNATESHFIEGTLFAAPGVQSAAGQVSVYVGEGNVQSPIHYESIEELVTKLSLPPEAAKKVVDRITNVVNR